MRRVTEATKKRENRGQGEGSSYKPYIKAREIGSLGTCSIIKDWKDGRQREFFSKNEAREYYILRWNDSVVDIREQYPLILEDTLRIADAMGFKHPYDRKTRMTTDMLVTYQDDTGNKLYKAYSIKNSVDVLNRNRTVEILRIEMAYWHLHGIPFEIIFGKQDINRVYAENIELVVDYYDIHKVETKIDRVKHLIAHKKIIVDMQTKPLDFQWLVHKYLKTEEQENELLLNYVVKDN